MMNVADIHPPCDTLLNVDGTSAGMVIENRLSDDGQTRIITVLHNGETTTHVYDLGDYVSIERREDCRCDATTCACKEYNCNCMVTLMPWQRKLNDSDVCGLCLEGEHVTGA